MNVNSLEKWNEVSERLREKGYTFFQSQYDVDLPQGYHVWFVSHGLPDVEIVTRTQSVRDVISRYFFSPD